MLVNVQVYWDVRTKVLAHVCKSVRLCLQVGDRISDEARRAIYPELLKRLDDSSNKVGTKHCLQRLCLQ